MQTDTVYAAHIENNDHIVENGEVLGYVYSIEDSGDFLHFQICDEEGEFHPLTIAPFDNVVIVTSFDEEFEFEDVEV